MKKYSALTLIEMMMAIAILIIGMAGISLLFSKTWKTNSYTLKMGQSALSVSQGLSKMVDYVRRVRQGDDGAYPVQLADDNEFIVYGDYDKDGITEKLHFYKSGQNVLMGVTEPTNTLPKTYPSGDQETMTIVSHIVNDSSTPIFYYFDENYPADQVNNPAVTPALAGNVRLVKIYFEINIDPGHAPNNVEMQSFVEMRNLGD